MNHVASVTLLTAVFAVPNVEAIVPNAPAHHRMHLVLLPGPALTSPAKGFPPPIALPVFTETIDARNTVPPIRRSPLRAATPPKEFAPAPKLQPPRKVDTLRFDTRLPAAPGRTLLQRPKHETTAKPALPDPNQ